MMSIAGAILWRNPFGVVREPGFTQGFSRMSNPGLCDGIPLGFFF